MITIQYDPTTHVLVPIEATMSMLIAAEIGTIKWAAILAAAPQAPAKVKSLCVGCEGNPSIENSPCGVCKAPAAQPLPMTDEQIINTLQEIDNIARDYDGYEYGLPFHVDSVLSEMVDSVRALFGQEAK